MSIVIGPLITKIAASILVGSLIGIERELEHKPAGLRTIVLVCLGSTVFMIIGMELAQTGSALDRIVAGVITGVGFLGAGAIIRGRGEVHGLTTAAAIWVSSGLGLAIGAGYYMLVAIVAIIALIVLRGLVFLERVINKK